MIKKRYCCYHPCRKRAIWQIWYGNTPDDYTESCSEHLVEMCTNVPDGTEYPIRIYLMEREFIMGASMTEAQKAKEREREVKV